ncbi:MULTISPECIES: TetR/AcrR family transcriptional regulator [Prauserella salsuginis group]|uniref:TetR/AcrR family transcriptional regulator n=1 Tax=Prauserella salsuginis TaxID=387889 RepID=A0ABW6G0Z8_9PSEU|nr:MULTISPECIES: TetR/AcrR family transcriptional regulator [Prauserella salsuginis group]MCR3722033.1 transcriptional regulator, TetR family [Prauserella flava]MCR3736039.1 transcriptional regulator, TetR family [Prauserella salsuginis]
MVVNRRGEASRSALLAAGKTAFSSRRYEEVSIVDLARELGVAAGSISYHFGGKRGFYLAVLEAAADEFWGDLLAMRGPALDRLSRGVDRLLDEAVQQPASFEALIADVADAEVRQIRERHRGRLADALAVEMTGSSSSVVLRAAISGFLSFVEGLVLHWLHTGEITRVQVKDLIMGNFFGAAMSALRVDPDIELTQRAIDAALSDAHGFGLFAGSSDVFHRAETPE